MVRVNDFRIQIPFIMMRNSHKNRIETSSSRFYSVCNAKASGLFLGEGLLERERRKGGSRVDLHGERTRLLSDLYDSPWFIRSWVRSFFPPSIHQFKKSEPINRHWRIDVLNSQNDQISFVDVSPSIRARNVIFLEDFEDGKS